MQLFVGCWSTIRCFSCCVTGICQLIFWPCVSFSNSIDSESRMPKIVQWNRKRIQEDVWTDWQKSRNNDGIYFNYQVLLFNLVFLFAKDNLQVLSQTSYAEFMADVQASTSHGMFCDCLQIFKNLFDLH